ncbi:DUF4190 domain-containing protein [Streptomyces sp. NPDC005423]|uniref:DUF4190 domain-containing protein n=1 Tax=Streptomyces sp. NPDC005423 TaxID=3155343 RepID=UPI0033A5BA16
MSIPPPPGPHQPQDPYQQGAYGPYPQQPYQGWGQGYTPYNRPAPVNGVAIASLVLGILCCLPGVGLVLGLIALSQIKKSGERGRSMAATGMVLSAFGLLVLVLGVATDAGPDFWDGVRVGTGSTASVSLEQGQCFDAPSGSLEGDLHDYDVVPCAGGHDGEVFAVVRMSDAAYPGDREVTRTANDRCYALQDSYAMDAWAVPDDVDVYFVTPTGESWNLGDREITCVFGNTDESANLTGSLREDASTLDPDQLAYLKAAHVLNTALDSAPEAGYVEDDLPGHRAWADRVSTALTKQSGMLDDHAWAAAAEKPVARLVTHLRAAREEWAKAAGATDADSFYEHYDKGAELIDPAQSVTARRALGLATTPPSDDENGGGTGGGGTGGGGGDSGGDTGLEV